MAIQTILSLAPSVPSAATKGLAEPQGGFDEALALAVGDPPPTVPPLASPPGSASGTEKEGVLPTLPNAMGTQLDFFLPSSELSETQPDALLASLAAVGLIPSPIYVASVPVDGFSWSPDGSAEILPSMESKAGLPTSFAPTSVVPMAATGSVESQPVITMPQGSKIVVAAETVKLEEAPVQPLVELKGMTRQSAPTPQVLDTQMLRDLGLQSMAQTEVWTRPNPVSPVSAPIAEDGTVAVAVVAPQAPASSMPVANSDTYPSSAVSPVELDIAVPAATASVSAQATSLSNLVVASELTTVVSHEGAPGPASVPTAKPGVVVDPALIDPDVPSANPALKLSQSSDPTAAATILAANPTANASLVEAAELGDEPLLETATVSEPESQPTGAVMLPNISQTVPAESVASKPDLSVELHREALKQTVERIEQMALQRPLTQMVIRLMPEELGSVLITVKTMGHYSEAEITVSNERLAVALESARPQLIQAVESKGVSLSQLTLQMGGGQTGQGQDQPQRGDFQRAQQFFQSMRPDAAATTVSANPSWASRATTLDLVI